MSINREALRKHYQTLGDGDIERLANYGAGDLVPEALEVLKDEIKRRGLSGELDMAVDIQVKGISEGELRELMRKISAFPCPLCGRQKSYLNGFGIMRVRGYIIGTKTKIIITIGCRECILKSARSALVKNLFLGWWAIPWGPIMTIRSMFVNLRAINCDNYNEPTQEFIEFIGCYPKSV